MDRVRLGLIGAGGMANRVHYPSLAEWDDVEMVALCDLDEGKLNETAEKFGIANRFTDYRTMLDEVEVDAVYILMPPHHLFDLVIDVIGRGKHVLIEKPPGVTSEQTRQMANAAEKAGVVSMVAFNRRYIPLLNLARKRVLDRGPMIQCVSTFYKDHRGNGPYYNGAIDILSCDAVHAVDTLRWMGGNVEQVSSDVQSRAGACYDNMFNALVRFENGGVGVLLTNWNVGGRRHTFEMHGEGISAFVDPDDRALIYEDNATEPETITTQEASESEEFRFYSGFAAENRHFIDCVKAGKETGSTLRDAVKTMELVDWIYTMAW
jgi:virulence factor